MKSIFWKTAVNRNGTVYSHDINITKAYQRDVAVVCSAIRDESTEVALVVNVC